ncbi:lytic transglycosylase domain-containing protein [Lentzea albidocapillata]|uniref:Transglycosylase SLT domain-containing protein n=1 Tax=Lentzea albidocapillata TaxID=40571 RepID=A0A1W2FU73_9PSEU|nr:transglycosylase SLT domain-containing protein [Lentzea albidocapillata]SMD25537.1 Transglycosylase SLT domain-containing protein [Lentzea albidocapillata]
MRVPHLVLAVCVVALAAFLAIQAVFVLPFMVRNGNQGAIAGAAPGQATFDITKIPPLAREVAPIITSFVATDCPELNPLRVIAEVQAESGWRPTAWSNDSNGGAAGLLQINQANWKNLGGQPWASVPPPSGADIFDPAIHMRLGLKFLCSNLRGMTAHLKQTGKSLDPHDAMSVCHIAGCGRVLLSRTGIPQSGEAGCGDTCVSLVRRYLDNIRKYEREWAAAEATPSGDGGPVPGGADLAGLPAPVPYAGPPTGCVVDDPTTAGCLTAATAHALQQIRSAFGPQIASVTCYGARPETPFSDHPTGKACDLFPDRFGVFPAGERLAAGWRMASWTRAYAGPLKIRYIIWQGRYWDPTTGDQGGWGEKYTGAGVYDVTNPTGGHYDHLHISFTA